MPFCPNCGTEVQTSANFCGACGKQLAMGEAAVGTVAQVPAVLPQILPYHISLGRVLLMSVLSYGFYLLYWFYLTWKQYRDHTRTEAYPVWHVLALSVPIYGLFRTHAHVRSFKELMLNAGLSTNLSAGGAVLLMLVNGVLGIIGLAAQSGSGDFSGELTRETALASTVVSLIGIAIVTGLILHVQGNLNRYWASLGNLRVTNARVGVGEVLFGIIGVLAWIATLSSLPSPT